MRVLRASSVRAAALLAVAIAAGLVGCSRPPVVPPGGPPQTAPSVAAEHPTATTPTPSANAEAAGPGFLAMLDRTSRNRVGYKFVIEERTKLYHWWNCPLLAQGGEVTPATMSREQLKAAGYAPCGQCRPDLDMPAPPPPDTTKPPHKLQAPIKVEAQNREAAPEGESAGESGASAGAGQPAPAPPTKP